MKVFLAGGTGVVGWRAVDLLVQAGHDVSVMARSDEKAAFVQSLGATPVRVSLFDAGAVREAVAGHEVVINLATHIPSTIKAARSSAWHENDRIRSEGSRNLVDAALAAGSTRYIQESIAFVYADGGDRWLDEDSPLVEPIPALVATAQEAERQANRMTDAGGTGIVLRFGFFHSADSELTVSAVKLTRWGRAPVFGSPDAYYPVIHCDDAAAAVVAALHAPAGIYNIVDDEPLTRAGYADAMAQALGDTDRLRLVPAALSARAGKQAPHLVASQRISNRQFRQATGWVPAFPSARETYVDIVSALREPRRVRSGLAALLLLVLAVSSTLVGLWAQFFPRSFYESFPGLGRAWVAVDGPFNEHLVRDVGGLNLALVVVMLVAAATMLTPLVRAAAAAALVYGLPHLLYHLGHLDALDRFDQIANAVSLGGSVVIAVAVLLLSRSAGASSAPARRRPTRRAVSLGR